MIAVHTLNAVLTGPVVSADKLPDPNKVVPGTISVFVFIFLALAVVFLIFSFRKQLRKVDGHFGVGTGGKSAEEKKDGTDQRA